jgi:predicted small secreted protein
MTRLAALALAALSVLVLSGCNTIQGVGRDIERAGQGLEDAVD